MLGGTISRTTPVAIAYINTVAHIDDDDAASSAGVVIGSKSATVTS